MVVRVKLIRVRTMATISWLGWVSFIFFFCFFWFCLFWGRTHNKEHPGQFVALLGEVVDENGQNDTHDQGGEESKGADDMEGDRGVERRFD